MLLKRLQVLTTLSDSFQTIRFPERISYEESEEKFSFNQRMDYLKLYGNHCMSFSTLQPGMNYFDMHGIGFIAYKKKWGMSIVLSDPICSKSHVSLLLKSFFENHKNVGFIQITQSIAELLHSEFGFYATQLGLETILDTKKWNLKGKKKQNLRTALNQAEKKGIYFKECLEIDEKTECGLSDEWLKTRKMNKGEIHFLVRPRDIGIQIDTRKFFAFYKNKLVGYIYFDPLYQRGKIVGYVPNISRFSKSFKQGIFYALMVHAVNKFKEEGIEMVHIGLSPLVLDKKNLPCESIILKRLMHLTYKYMNRFYNFKGIHFTKSRFQGDNFKTFVAHQGKLPLRGFTAIFKITNVF